MDEAARLRILVEAVGVARAQHGLRAVDRGLHRTAASARRSSDAIARSTRESSGSFMRVAKYGAAYLGARGLGRAFGSTVRSGFRFNAQMESNEIGMRRFIGSTRKTRRYLGELQKVADKTPFELTDLTAGARRLLAFGMSAKQAKTTLQGFGDAIAAQGGGAEEIQQVTRALGQVQAKGKVYAEELLQFTEAGIPAFQILKRELGLSEKQMKDIGRTGIKASVAIKALTQGVTRDFGGAGRQQAKTWDGMMSTLRDAWARTTGAMTAGLFNEAKKWLPRVTATVNRVGAIFRNKRLTFGEKLRLSAGIVQRRIIDPIRRRISKMRLGDRLGEVFRRAAPAIMNAMAAAAPKAAVAFVRAFKEAGPWGRLLTVAFLAHRLGAFSALGSLAAERFWRRYRRRSMPAAAAAGTAAGAANAATFTTAARGGIIARKGRFRGAALAIGRFMGPLIAIPIALEISNYLTKKFGHKGGTQGQINKTASKVRDIIDDARNPNPAIKAPRRGVPRDPSIRPKAAMAYRERDRERQARRARRRERRPERAPVRTEPFRTERFRDQRTTTNPFRRDRTTTTRTRDRTDRADRAGEAADRARQRAKELRGRTERAHRDAVARARKTERKRRGGMSGDDFQLNIGSVRIPTAYEVKRTRLESPAGTSPTLVKSRPQPTTTIHGGVVITINGAKDPKQVAAEVAAVLDHTRKTHGAAVKRARAKKRRHHG